MNRFREAAGAHWRALVVATVLIEQEFLNQCAETEGQIFVSG
jgi:hypothetical protein